MLVCGVCQESCAKIEKHCPVCEALDLSKPRCICCLGEVKSSLSILPLACFEPNHKFPFCFDCVDKVEKTRFACRICAGKEQQNFVVFKYFYNVLDDECLLAYRILSNELTPRTLAADPECCPFCDPISIRPFYVRESVKIAEADSPFLLSSAAAAVGDAGIVLTGGFRAVDMRSSADCFLVEFLSDGRAKSYACREFAPLCRPRNSHGCVYYPKEETLFVFGGVLKENLESLEYLDSVEACALDRKAVGEFSTALFKLKKPRAFFSYILHGSSVYIFGGVTDLDTPENSIERLDLSKKECSVVEFDLRGKLAFPLKPALFPLPEDRILILGGMNANKTLNTQPLILDIKNEKMLTPGEAELRFASEGRTWVVEAFQKKIAFGGKRFGPLVKEQNKEVQGKTQFKFKVLEEEQPEVMVDWKIEGAKEGQLLNENHYLFDGMLVRFVQR